MRTSFIAPLVLAVALASFTGNSVGQTSPIQPQKVDAFVDKVLKDFEVPGISLAIVKDGKVILAKGYGVRKLGEDKPVDEHTLFGIASNTKAFTATAIGMLVEDGKLEWDAKVINYLPWFQMSDPFVTRELTVRDLLVHRSGLGLGAGDLLWWPPSTYEPKEIARRLRYIPLATSFRNAYAYDNVLYLVAGQLIEAVSGTTWENFITTRILKPAGMEETVILGPGAAKRGEAAATHARVDGIVQGVDPFTADNINPAAGLNTNARDIAKWMIVQLDSGRSAEGTKLFSPRTTRELWKLVTPVPIGDPPPGLPFLRPNFNGYALGFGVRDYRGKKIVSHTGGLPGYVSRLTMVPEIKLGIAVLTNQESGNAFNAVTYEVLDKYLGAPAMDWEATFLGFEERGDSMTAAREKEIKASRDSTRHPSLPLGKYAGKYTDAWYGDITVSNDGGKLSIGFSHTPSLTGELVPWQYDTFVARWKDRGLRADAFVTFSLNSDGEVEGAKMKAVSPATDFSFDFQDLDLKPAKEDKKQ
jgi:CubicO group peptidase (beta-lactamase class C family)